MVKVNKTKRQNKYKYLFVIQGNFGNYWEDLEETEDYQEFKYLLKETRLAYRTTGQIRTIKRRELNQ